MPRYRIDYGTPTIYADTLIASSPNLPNEAWIIPNVPRATKAVKLAIVDLLAPTMTGRSAEEIRESDEAMKLRWFGFRVHRYGTVQVTPGSMVDTEATPGTPEALPVLDFTVNTDNSLRDYAADKLHVVKLGE